ncbi:STAS domain-containing protein [Candidatus Mycobacterium wuenschmannii]|uniref:STAS domain-containing protein n=1 Tax=Candidatus Mycobacterium wuenschmannii TaxID=3027808 RepID=A0ABY8W0H7_9MYCO|nr:STAS domain-containing protein [Candidatus Mycobacterium wuenschmannii]WIM89252.1 STAS domain-containing protein [Candidatus Mycobacterium wuenschmannii]
MFTSTVDAQSDAAVMRLSGILNARTYQEIRDSVVKVAVDEARAVIVDVNNLDVRDGESWAVFTSARWCVQQWPEVPIVLVSSDPAVRARLTALSVARYVPVYDTVAAAHEALGDGTCRYLHRAREWFEPSPCSVNTALLFVHEHLLAWSMRDRVPVASTVVTVFAENALAHTRAGFDIRLEGTDDEAIVAVSDSSHALAVRQERPPGSCPASLDIVSSLCRRWGNTPTTTGKTVWARIGPNDTFAGITRPRR